VNVIIATYSTEDGPMGNIQVYWLAVSAFQLAKV
jgi:hypothetical protein